MRGCSCAFSCVSCWYVGDDVWLVGGVAWRGNPNEVGCVWSYCGQQQLEELEADSGFGITACCSAGRTREKKNEGVELQWLAGFILEGGSYIGGCRGA